MDLFDRVITKIKQNQARKERGEHVGIPYPFPRVEEEMRGIQKGQVIGLLAGSGVGKSKLLRYLFIYHAYKFSKENNYPINILYFALEDSKEHVMKMCICHHIYDLYKVRLSVKDLDSRGQTPLSSTMLARIEESASYFKELISVLKVYDAVSTPSEIYDTCIQHASTLGEMNYKEYEINNTLVKAPVRFKADINVHTLVLVDNYANITTDKTHKTEHEAIGFLSRFYIRSILAKRLGFTVVGVLQTDFSKERQQYTNAGVTIMSKIEPSLDGIAKNKEVARDFHIIFGLFNPDRFEIEEYPKKGGYNIKILKERFRSLILLKQNEGVSHFRCGLLFNGASESFMELPRYQDEQQMQQVYQKIISNQL